MRSARKELGGAPEGSEAAWRGPWGPGESVRRSLWGLGEPPWRAFGPCAIPRLSSMTARDRNRGLMGYGVIGSPTDSGSVSLGSSPGTPAEGSLIGRAVGFLSATFVAVAPLCSGLARRPLKAVAPVRIRSGLRVSLLAACGSFAAVRDVSRGADPSGPPRTQSACSLPAAASPPFAMAPGGPSPPEPHETRPRRALP